MLKDKIKNFFMPKKEYADIMPIPLKGKLEIIASRNGEVFHYDVSDNEIMVWSKHAMMQLLSGENYSKWGSLTQDFWSQDFTSSYSYGTINRPDLTVTANHTQTTNSDGILISNKSFFWDTAEFPKQWSQPNYTVSSSYADWNGINSTEAGYMLYPIFPTKMVFGTGKEFNSWDNNDNYSVKYYTATYSPTYNNSWDDILSAQHGWTNTYTQGSNCKIAPVDHDLNTVTANYYSATVTSSGLYLVKTRTVNDVFVRDFSTSWEFAITTTDFGIRGTIKNNMIVNTLTSETYALDPYDRSSLQQDYNGLGQPAFIYFDRQRRPYAELSESYLNADEGINYYHRLTFQVTMPKQTEAGEYYPYNGYTLKQAGLFCDARLAKANDTLGVEFDPSDFGAPSNTATSIVAIKTQAANMPFWAMPCGMMIAKRSISPITKNWDVAITAKWTLYLTVTA